MNHGFQKGECEEKSIQRIEVGRNGDAGCLWFLRLENVAWYHRRTRRALGIIKSSIMEPKTCKTEYMQEADREELSIVPPLLITLNGKLGLGPRPDAFIVRPKAGDPFQSSRD